MFEAVGVKNDKKDTFRLMTRPRMARARRQQHEEDQKLLRPFHKAARILYLVRASAKLTRPKTQEVAGRCRNRHLLSPLLPSLPLKDWRLTAPRLFQASPRQEAPCTHHGFPFNVSTSYTGSYMGATLEPTATMPR